MEVVYVLFRGNECDWEDIIILSSIEEAINESKKYPNGRVEIFSKNNKSGVGYYPSYNYYKNGELIESELKPIRH